MHVPKERNIFKHFAKSKTYFFANTYQSQFESQKGPNVYYMRPIWPKSNRGWNNKPKTFDFTAPLKKLNRNKLQ